MEELINKFQAWQILVQTAHNAQKRGAIALEEAGNIFEAVKIGERAIAELKELIQMEQEKSKAEEQEAAAPAAKSVKGNKASK